MPISLSNVRHSHAWINAIVLKKLTQRYGRDGLELCWGSYLARLSARQLKLSNYAIIENRALLLREAQALQEESIHLGCYGLAHYAEQLIEEAAYASFVILERRIAQMPALIARTRCEFRQSNARLYSAVATTGASCAAPALMASSSA